MENKLPLPCVIWKIKTKKPYYKVGWLTCSNEPFIKIWGNMPEGTHWNIFVNQLIEQDGKRLVLLCEWEVAGQEVEDKVLKITDTELDNILFSATEVLYEFPMKGQE